MRPREIKWLIAIVFIGILSGIMIKSWQYWQRNHFQCSGEMQLLNAGYQGDISLSYVFDSNRGLAIIRGEITPPQGETFTINQNIWFSFTRDGQHYFLRSETVSASIGETEQEEHIKRILPAFSSSRRCRFTSTSSGSTGVPGCCIPAGRHLYFAKPD